MREDRFFWGILIGIGLLVVVALIVFFVRPNTVEYVADGSASGQVQDYLTALYAGDYERAYGYVADGSDKVALETFRIEAENSLQPQLRNTSVEVVGEEVNPLGNRATVTITILRGGGVLDQSERYQQDVTLVRQNEEWKISWAPDPFWIYGWVSPDTPAIEMTPTPTATP